MAYSGLSFSWSRQFLVVVPASKIQQVGITWVSGFHLKCFGWLYFCVYPDMELNNYVNELISIYNAEATDYCG